MNEISRKELQKYMSRYDVDYSIGDFTPTVCALNGLTPPEACGGMEIAPVLDQAHHLFGSAGGARRTLIFCPDAVGQKHREKYPDLLARVERLAGLRFLSSSVMPSVTPVCYATIFSGASPEVHGIRKYEKPVLSVPTLFDVFAAAGKQVAIVAVNGCSIDTIFRNREVDYYSLRNDELSHRITRQLIEEDRYDLIVSYYTSHDHLAHVSGCDSPETVRALETAVNYFETLVADTDRFWGSVNRVVTWTPDHGNHPVDESSGVHGMDIPEDMLVNHYYRIRRGSPEA